MAEQKAPKISISDKNVKSPQVVEPVEDKDNSVVHDKETHGKSDDINENTPVEEVKGPGVLERAKEEIEAVVGAVLPKK